MTRLHLVLVALGAIVTLSAEARAQNVCNLIYQSGDWVSVGEEGQRVINASGPLLVQCARGEELRADSAVIYEAINEVHLFRRVDYQDPAKSLTSDYATYNGDNGRLWATGNVVFTDKNRGSTLRGPNLEYYRAGEGRPDAQAIATERPHLTVAPRENSRQREPMEVDADRITTVGEKFVTATGNVVIDGKEMDAWAEEAYYDADQERLELRRNARTRGERYELTGDYIESDLTEGELEKVLSRGNSRLVEERLRVTGPQLQLFFARDTLQRLISGRMPGGDSVQARSVALGKGLRIEADSLEAITPRQRLRQVIAIGTAEGQSWDTLRVQGPAPADTTAADTLPTLGLEEQDLIFADTIIGFFRHDSAGADSIPADSAAADGARPPSLPAADTARADSVPGDTARAGPGGEDEEAELERMLALGSARSLYRMRPSRADSAGADARRGINYVIADTIELTFLEGEVDIATVRGLKRGVYLDPLNADSARADSLRRDSTRLGVAGDSVRAGSVRPDSAGAPPPPAPAAGDPNQPAPSTPPPPPPAAAPANPPAPERRPTAGGRR